jgi:hypothetical protein
MCGIVGYVGRTMDDTALNVVMEGLARLEYRGYDSAGVALVTEDGVATEKRSGKLENLRSALEAHPLAPSRTGIGHTRWATHGGPTDDNAHPHLGGPEGNRWPSSTTGSSRTSTRSRPSCSPQGVEFASETDTEVAAHLVGGVRPPTTSPRPCSPRSPPRRRLHPAGDARRQPGVVVGARRNSPLVVGLGDGANYLGSDVAAFIGHTRDALELGQDQIVTITPTRLRGDRLRRHPRRGRRYDVDWDAAAAEKGGYESFMAKEIDEQPHAVADTLLGRTKDDGASSSTNCASPRTLGPSTRSSSSRAARPRMRGWSRSTPSSTGPGSRSRSSWPTSSATRPDRRRRTLVVSISQSGETMDTLMAVKHARELGALTVSICNTHGSTIPRESDAVLYTHAGPGDRGRLDQGLPRPDHRLLPARASTSRNCAAAARRRRAGGHARAARRCPTRSRPCSTDGPGHRDRPLHGRHPIGALPRPPRRLPDRARGRAQAQGDRLHPRRGLRGGRAQARPDRAHRARPAGVRRRARPGHPARAAQEGRLQHPGDPGPRRPHPGHRRGRRRGRRALRRRGDPGARDAPLLSRCSPSCRCRSSRCTWRRPRAWTSTSRATSPSPSPWSER